MTKENVVLCRIQVNGKGQINLVTRKFEMLIYKSALLQVIRYYVMFAFLFVQTVYINHEY